MSLNWDTRNVEYFKKNPDELWVNDDLNVETKSLVFGSMSIGIGSITEKNCIDFYARWKTLEKLDKAFYLYSVFIDNEKTYQYLTMDIVRKHIGLSTNVGFESQSNWSKRMASNWLKGKVSPKEIDAYVTVFKLEAKEESEQT